MRAETLLLHSRGDRVVNFACAEELAAGIPGARLVGLDSDNHVVLEGEAAWGVAKRELNLFLGD